MATLINYSEALLIIFAFCDYERRIFINNVARGNTNALVAGIVATTRIGNYFGAEEPIKLSRRGRDCIAVYVGGPSDPPCPLPASSLNTE